MKQIKSMSKTPNPPLPNTNLRKMQILQQPPIQNQQRPRAPPLASPKSRNRRSPLQLPNLRNLLFLRGEISPEQSETQSNLNSRIPQRNRQKRFLRTQTSAKLLSFHRRFGGPRIRNPKPISLPSGLSFP